MTIGGRYPGRIGLTRLLSLCVVAAGLFSLYRLQRVIDQVRSGMEGRQEEIVFCPPNRCCAACAGIFGIDGGYLLDTCGAVLRPPPPGSRRELCAAGYTARYHHGFGLAIY